jgi:Right handed beta helix region
VTGLLASLSAAAPTVAAPSPGRSVATRPDAAGTGVAPDRGRRPVGAGTPKKVCGRPLLDGPATRPHGAKVVRTTQDLPTLVDRAAPGTTFWLMPGVHTFGDDQYDQVGPKDGDTFIGAPGAVIDGRGVNRYAFGGDAHGVTISYLTIQNFGRGIDDNNGEGVVNHDSGDGWFVHHNTIQRDAGAGVFLADGSRVVKNCLRDNGEYGFSSFEFDGVENIVLRGNEIARNNTADWEARSPGCGCSGGGKFWDTRNARVVGNYVHHNHGPGLWADTDDVGFLFQRNYISDNDGEGIFYEISYNASIRRNTFTRNGWTTGRAEGGFPLASIYLSEAGSDARAGKQYGRHLRISGNLFANNWSGIMAWENPDRFSGSPVNSSAGYTTLVNPAATEQNCAYFDDCRWKTQHLRVVNNQFLFDPTSIPGCTAERGCGFMGLVANVGTVPDWSPYKGYVVPDDISLHQDNVWRHNTYSGPWRFMIRQLGSGQVSWSQWRSAPWNQDAGSSRK